MILPNMRYGSGITKGGQIAFGGLNHSLGAGDGELWDMKNLTSDHYPVLASRNPRWLCCTLQAAGGLFCWDGLCWVDGTSFVFDGEEKGRVTEGDKTFATLGAYILIMPDKCYYNVDTGEFGSMESKWSGRSLTFEDGVLYGETATANAIRCDGVNWCRWFNTGDAVTIAGCTTNPGNNMTIIIRDMDGDKLYFYEHSFTLAEDGKAYEEVGEMTIERTVPDIKYMCENENRLWGCTDNTIYASKLGDVFNWQCYDGLETDSWAVDTGSAGVFTGCVSYGGFPVFFKEDHVYKVYGSTPSNFEVMGSATMGLAAGSHRSMAVAGETLFYLSRNGIMAYTGGIPQPMGAEFGVKRFRNAVGGSDGLKYYVSMQDERGIWGLYVYDTQRGLWHKEDDSCITHFAKWKGNLYFLNDKNQLWMAGDAQDPPEDAKRETGVEWFAEFADFTAGSPNKKGIGKIQIRLELDAGATANVWMMFDSDGVWQPVWAPLGEGVKRSYYLPIVPRRADHYRLRITGTGGCRIFSLAREQYHGSELRSRRE